MSFYESAPPAYPSVTPANGVGAYYGTKELQQVNGLGQMPASTMGWALWTAGFASSIALTYHGYKRNHSVGWALAWGILGGIVWPITMPIALAQGFGKHK